MLKLARNWNPQSEDWTAEESCRGGVSGHFKFQD